MEYLIGFIACLASIYLVWYLVTRFLITLAAIIIWRDNGRAKGLLFLLWLSMMCPLFGEAVALGLAILFWLDA